METEDLKIEIKDIKEALNEMTNYKFCPFEDDVDVINVLSKHLFTIIESSGITFEDEEEIKDFLSKYFNDYEVRKLNEYEEFDEKYFFGKDEDNDYVYDHEARVLIYNKRS